LFAWLKLSRRPSNVCSALAGTDGVGEWATTSVGIGRDHGIEILKVIHFPHSLGLFYAAFTDYTGFKVNSGEYTVMGLAPYGQRLSDTAATGRGSGASLR
jgi:predicted NodU family carbamoyl transferase